VVSTCCAAAGRGEVRRCSRRRPVVHGHGCGPTFQAGPVRQCHGAVEVTLRLMNSTTPSQATTTHQQSRSSRRRGHGGPSSTCSSHHTTHKARTGRVRGSSADSEDGLSTVMVGQEPDHLPDSGCTWKFRQQRVRTVHCHGGPRARPPTRQWQQSLDVCWTFQRHP